MRIDEIFGVNLKRPQVAVSPVPQSVEELMQWAGTQGVELEVVETASRIELHDIGRVIGPKGSGAAVMQALCRFADQHHKPVALEALDDNPKRIAYFRQFGFAAAPTAAKIEDAGLLMIRPTHMAYA